MAHGHVFNINASQGVYGHPPESPRPFQETNSVFKLAINRRAAVAIAMGAVSPEGAPSKAAVVDSGSSTASQMKMRMARRFRINLITNAASRRM